MIRVECMSALPYSWLSCLNLAQNAKTRRVEKEPTLEFFSFKVFVKWPRLTPHTIYSLPLFC